MPFRSVNDYFNYLRFQKKGARIDRFLMVFGIGKLGRGPWMGANAGKEVGWRKGFKNTF